MPVVFDDAVCIRVWDWSETSQTVSLFGREIGVVRGLAKGARREKAPFSGGFEVPMRGEAGVIIKHNPESLATLTQWDLREIFSPVRQSLGNFYAAMAIADIVHHAIRDHDPHPGLYDAMLLSLRAIATSGPTAALVQFLWATLTETGYRPELTEDVRRGGRLETQPDAPIAFSPRLGGFFTLQSGERAEELGAWRVRVETMRLLVQVSAAPAWAPAADSRPHADRAARLLAAYLREVIGTDIAALGPALGTSLGSASGKPLGQALGGSGTSVSAAESVSRTDQSPNR